MMDSATDSTITIAVCRRQAADEGGERQHIGMGDQRQGEHVHVAVDLSWGEGQGARRWRSAPEQIDQHEIERETARRRA